MHILLALVGAVLGALTGIDGGILLGGIIGFFGSLLWRQNKSIAELQTRLDQLGEGKSPAAKPAQPEPQPRTGQVAAEPSATAQAAAAPQASVASPASAAADATTESR